jgi:hypothetical protein
MESYNKTSCFYKHVVVDIPHTYMKTVIGKKGKNLKTCCENGVNHAWFNMKRSIIELWGPPESIDTAASNFTDKISVARKLIPEHEIVAFKKENKPDNTDTMISGSLVDALPVERVKFLIGRNGYNFKRVTRESGVSFIWYNETTHAVDIWGPVGNLQKAIDMLFDSIKKTNSIVDTKDIDMDLE